MRLILYTRRGCHLCVDMQFDLEPYERRGEVVVELVDVDTDAKLRDRYGDRLPVLVADDGEVCFGWLDEEAVRERLRGAGVRTE